jgi:LPS sulfotransferase NodH
MLWRDWWRLLRRNHFRVHPLRWGLAGTVSALTLFNSTMGTLSRWRYGHRVQGTRLTADPIFIVGHWRSGTTYLHELLSCDTRFATPTTYECFAANHFLFTRSWLPRLAWFIMPSQRPMDNVRTGWDSPQEDEFALCSLGTPSPYLRMAFPNEPDQYLEYLDLQTLPAEALRDWQGKLNDFLSKLTWLHQKRLILKSPTHTARIAVLAQMFPQAKFLHIVRNPLTVYPSTLNLWHVLDAAQGLQIPHNRHLKAYVLAAFERMYTAFERQRAALRGDQIFDLRYEDLVDDPVVVLRTAYEHLQLGDFEAVRPALETMTQANRRYRTNQYQLDEPTVNEIMTRWSDYAVRYGYAK